MMAVDLESEDAVDPVTILPEEMWERILAKLEAKDAYSCLRVCVTFHSLLEPKRCLILVHLVLPLLKSKRLLTNNIGLLCRQVCWEWKLAVDEYWHCLDIFERRMWNGVKFLEIDLEQPDSDDDSDDDAQVDSKCVKHIVTNLETLVNAYGPSLFKAVGVPVEDSTGGGWDSVEHILGCIGQHVETCRMSVRQRNGIPEVYQRLTLLLSKMSKLRVLYLTKEWSEWVTYDDQCPKKFPFDLPRLVAIDLEGLPSSLNQAVLSCARESSLKTLAIRGKDGVGGGEYDCLELQKFINVEEIMVENLKNTNSILACLKISSWTLKKANLNIQLKPGYLNTSLSIADVFGVLSRFGSLIELQLSFCGECDKEDDGSELRLDLPLLENLDLQTSPKVKLNSLEFVLNLKELKNLHLDLNGIVYDMPDQQSITEFCQSYPGKVDTFGDKNGF